MFKKSLLLFLSVILLTAGFNTEASASGEPVTVILNGQEVSFDVEPRIINGRTLVPFRKIFEALNFEISWDGEKRIAAGQNKFLDLKVIFEIGYPAVFKTIYGVEEYIEEKPIDVPADIIDGRTLIPLRALSDSIGAEILWDGVTRTATVSYNPYFRELSLNTPAAIEDPIQSVVVNSLEYISYGEIRGDFIEVTYKAEVRGSGAGYLNFYDKNGKLLDYEAAYFYEGVNEYSGSWPLAAVRLVISGGYDTEGIEESGGGITTNTPFKVAGDYYGENYLFIHDCDFVSKSESLYPAFEGSCDYKFIIEAENTGYTYANCFDENDAFLTSVYLYIYEGTLEYTLEGVPDGLKHIEFSKTSSAERSAD